MGTAGFDREEDYWPRQWAEAYLKFATEEKSAYIAKLGIKLMFMVGWAERGDGSASGHGNSVPRFHVSWGTGTGVVKPFVDKAYAAQEKGLLQFRFRHRVTKLLTQDGAVIGIGGDILADDHQARGVAELFLQRLNIMQIRSLLLLEGSAQIINWYAKTGLND